MIKDNAVAPILSSATLAKFCEAEGFEKPKRVPIVASIGAQIDHCYPNVERQIALYGGARVLGYKIIEFPKLMLQAIHHAVWLDRKGRMVDVTPDVRKWRNVVFSCDAAATNSDAGASMPAFPRFMNVSGLTEIDEAIEISLRLTRMRLAHVMPNGMLPELDQTDPDVVRLLSDARSLVSIAQAKVSAK